jgi:hypothetical protein
MSCIISPPTRMFPRFDKLEIMFHQVSEVVQQQAVVDPRYRRGVAVQDLEDQYVAGRVVVQGRILIK